MKRTVRLTENIYVRKHSIKRRQVKCSPGKFPTNKRDTINGPHDRVIHGESASTWKPTWNCGYGLCHRKMCFVDYVQTARAPNWMEGIDGRIGGGWGVKGWRRNVCGSEPCKMQANNECRRLPCVSLFSDTPLPKSREQVIFTWEKGAKHKHYEMQVRTGKLTENMSEQCLTRKQMKNEVFKQCFYCLHTCFPGKNPGKPGNTMKRIYKIYKIILT